MIEKQAKVYSIVTSNVVNLTRLIGNVSAIGLSGSYARGGEDTLSDIDVCVFVDGVLPPPQARRQAYAGLGLTDFIYFDVDFEFSHGDGIMADSVRCDFNWMSTAVVLSFLRKMERDFDCPEFIPGGLSTVEDLYDPNKVIDRLQQAIPQYSDARARHRIAEAIGGAHTSLYGLEWLKKAAFRDDHFLFLKYKYNLLEALFRALFALNHVWLSEEKRLTKRVASFRYVPERIEARIRSVIMHQNADSDLNHCMTSLKQLFADTVVSVHRRYPGLDLPSEWR
jgi:predicted nucleotidyltransferase